MKLVQKIERNDFLLRNFGIYELNEEEREKYGNNYVLSQGIFNECVIENETDKILSNINELYYEGFFETQKEAYMQVKLVEMKTELERLKSDMKKMLDKMQIPEW